MDNNENNGIDRESFFGGCLTALILSGVGWMFLLLILSGCSPRVIETVRTEYVYQDRIERDTTIVHDYVHVREFVKGDTIRIEKWHTKYIEKATHDTLYQHKTDSVPVPYPVEKLVERELSWWQQTRMHLGEALLAIAGIAVVVFVIKRKFL